MEIIAEQKKQAIVESLTKQIRDYEFLQDLGIPDIDLPEENKKKRGRPFGSKTKIRYTVDRIFLTTDKYGVPKLQKVKVEMKKVDSYICLFYFKCGACFLDGFNMRVCKRLANYKCMKFNSSNPVCNHLANCPGCDLAGTFTVIYSFDELQPLSTLRNAVANQVQIFKQNGMYPTLIN